jgi:hypothetical protein
MQSAFDRVIRTLIVSIGIGGSVFTILGVGGIIAQTAILNPVFSIVSIVIFAALPVLMAIVAFQAPVRVLRYLAGFHAIATLALLALWVPSMTQPDALSEANGAQLPWIMNMITLATSEAAIALPFVGGWLYLVAAAAVSGVVRFITFGSPDPLQAIQDAIFIVLISGFMMALIQLTQVAGRQQDLVAKAALDDATAAAARETLDRQRAQYQTFTREDVLATLDAAVHNTTEARSFARQSAMRALQKMDQLSSVVPTAAATPVEQFDTQLRTAALLQGFPYQSLLSSGTTALNVPLEVCDAIVEAMTEAMVNSNKHADHRGGKTVHRSARASRLHGGVQIVVRDDGKGFSVRRLPLDRLGIRLTIFQAMNAVPGGSAKIVSGRGRGTTVTIEWKGNTNEQ